MRKLLLFITALAVISAAFAFTACGAEEEKGTPIDVDIPHVGDFTCDYYAADGTRITDKATVFDPGDEITVKIGFMISTDAFEAGKSKFTLKFMPDEGFTGRITSANSSSTSDAEFTATFATDDKNPKKCTIETKIGINYSGGNLKIGYFYDDEEISEACVFPLNNDKTLSFTYDDALGGYVVADDYGAFEEIVIPDEIMGKPIKKIADSAFSGCKTLKKIVLSDNISIIGKSAFGDCSELLTLVLSDNIEQIGENAFGGCGKIRGKEQGNGVCKYIGSARNEYLCLFKVKKTDIEYFQINENCKFIYDRALGDCGALKYITLPSGVTRIGTGAFANCAVLKEVVLSDGIEDIGYDAFKNCNKLAYNKDGKNSYLGSADNEYAYLIKADYGEATATVHENCKVIGRYAFNYSKRIEGNTPSLTSVTLPSGVRNINDGAFYYCRALETAVLPDTVKTMGNDAFYLCDKLKSVTLGDGLKVIGDHAFKYCESLEDMTIPDSVEEFGEGAFWGCEKLLRTEERTAEGGKCYYTGTKSNKYAVLTSVDASDVVVKDGCVAIAVGAFSGLTKLRTVVLPDSVTTIGAGAFNGCTSLENVTIPAGVTTIGDRAFSGSNLKTVTIPEGVKSIGISAFSGCENLETVNFPSTLTEICDGAFSGCKNLKSLTLPDSVERIGNEAFYNCHALTTVDLPERLEKINYRAFRMCISLKNATLRGNINRIEVQAFDFTHKLKEITFIGTRRALLDILSSLPEKSECFDNTVTAHYTDGDLRFGNTCDGEVLIYLREPVFVKN